MTHAEIIRRRPGRKVVRVGEVTADLPPEDEAAWLLVLRDWCKGRRGAVVEDHAVRVRAHHRVLEHATHR